MISIIQTWNLSGNHTEPAEVATPLGVTNMDKMTSQILERMWFDIEDRKLPCKLFFTKKYDETINLSIYPII